MAEVNGGGTETVAERGENRHASREADEEEDLPGPSTAVGSSLASPEIQCASQHAQAKAGANRKAQSEEHVHAGMSLRPRIWASS